MRSLMLEFWRDASCCQDDNFTQELILILHELQQHGSIGIECVCLTGLPADLFPIENVWRIMKRGPCVLLFE